MRFQRVVRDQAAELKSHFFVEWGGTVLFGGVKHQQRASVRDCKLLGGAQGMSAG